MSPGTKYLTRYEQDTVRDIGEQYLRIRIEQGTTLTTAVKGLRDWLVPIIGIRRMCRQVRLQLEMTGHRDLNRAILEIGRWVARNSPAKVGSAAKI